MVNWDQNKTERAADRAQTREATRLGGEPPERQPRGRKDTRHWCRGKEGVEHIVQIRPRDPKWGDPNRVCHLWQPHPKYSRWICYEQEICTTCGKILKHSLGAKCTYR